MISAFAPGRAWSRKVQVWGTLLTGVAAAGVPITLFGSFATVPGGFKAGCGGFIGVMVILVGVYLAAVLLVGVIAGLGVLFLWLRSRWGPLLLMPSNLLMMGFYGLSAIVFPGQWLWGIVVIVLAATPALAIALLSWPLWSRGRLWVRLIEVGVMVLLAVPCLYLYAPAIVYDASSIVQPGPPPAVASRGCSGGLIVVP